VNDAGESGGSTEANATPVAPGAVPAAPAAAPIVTAGNGKNFISWNPIAGVTSYNLYWGMATGVTTGTGTQISGITNKNFLHSGLTNGATYFYILTPVNEIGEGPASTEASGTPAAPTAVPAVPAGLT